MGSTAQGKTRARGVGERFDSKRRKMRRALDLVHGDWVDEIESETGNGTVVDVEGGAEIDIRELEGTSNVLQVALTLAL